MSLYSLPGSRTNPIVYTQIPRPPKELLDRLQGVYVANIADAMGKPGFYTMSTDIRPAFSDILMAGPAITVKEMPSCNLMFHKACDLAEAGDVIVIDVGGYTGVAPGGWNMCRKLVSKGVKGVVVDGAWRDRAEIRKRRFPVFSRGWQPNGPHKDWPGSVNIPIQCGGVTVKPGDIVVGDDDGIIVIPLEVAESVIEGAKRIAEYETKNLQETRKEVIERHSPYASDEALRKLGVDIR